ncbi:PHO85 cyclin Pho80p [Monosporozyma servazzii]
MQNATNELDKQDKQEKSSPSIPTVTLPIDFYKCSRTDLIALISRMLVFLIHINENGKQSDPDDHTRERKLTRFHSSVPPPISVYNYLMRLAKYSSIEQCVLLTSLYYIDLLSSIYKDFTLNSLTVHRFLLASTTVASKGLCDSFCTNAHYSKVGGVQCSELNILETEFLRRVNYRVLPRDDNITLCKYETHLGKFTITGDPDYDHLLNVAQSRPSSGYNVLNMYYRKIIQLVGKYNTASDTSRKANFVLETVPQPQPECTNTPQKRRFDATETSAQRHSNNIPTNGPNNNPSLLPHKRSHNRTNT